LRQPFKTHVEQAVLWPHQYSTGFSPALRTVMSPPLTFFMLLPDNDFDDFGSLVTFVRFEAVLVLDLDLVAISFFSP
jgi:hypothetical protein